jgi:homoserine dehydrogenase
VNVALMLVGFGNVGRQFVHLLDELSPALAARGIEPRVVGIVTRRHGALFDEAGLDAVAAARRVSGGSVLGSAAPPSLPDLAGRLRSQRVETRVLVETTTLDIRFGEPAISHVRAGFAAGAHVITANKGPVAFAYRALAREAAAAGVSFLFEGAVMDGIPVFNLVRETMPGVTVRGIRGIVNTTTNFLLSAMERGEAYADTLARMQAEGIAEADPSLDVDGWDAAAKTAALANVLLDAGIDPTRVRREAVVPDTAGRARAALGQGRRLKLVATARRRDEGTEGVDAYVQLEELAASDPLAATDGHGNALELDTWPLGRVVITQRDGGLEQTAYALFSDLITAVTRERSRS